MATKKAKRKSKSPQDILTEKATAFMVDEQKLLKKYGLARQIVVTFPKRESVPLMGKVAVKLLKWSGGVIEPKFGLIVKQ